MAECWRPWRDGTYEVSDLGRVRRAKPGISTYVGRIVVPCDGATGYPTMQLVSDGKSKRVYLHHVVAEVFIGERPNGMVINHIDRDRKNAAAINLEYVSQLENVRHALAGRARNRGPAMPPRPLKGRPCGDSHWTKTKPDRIARADRMPHSKMNAELVASARARAESGEKQCVLAKEYGISPAQISRIIRGTRWTAM